MSNEITITPETESKFLMLANHLHGIKKNRDTSIGEIVGILGHAELLEPFQEWLMDELMVSLTCEQRDIHEDLAAWDSYIAYENGKFYCVGSDGPSGGTGKTVKIERPITETVTIG